MSVCNFSIVFDLRMAPFTTKETRYWLMDKVDKFGRDSLLNSSQTNSFSSESAGLPFKLTLTQSRN